MQLWFRNEASSDNEPAITALGNSFYYNYDYRSQLYQSLTLRRRFDHFIYVLLTALEAGPQLSNERKEAFSRDRFTSLLSDLNHIRQFDAKNIPSYGVDNPQEYRAGVIQNALPGEQWFAGWELIGLALANQSDKFEVSR